MIGLLLTLLWLQINPGPVGVASGVVLSSNGTPAAGVRVFAIPAGTSDSVTVNATVFDGLTQTDATGRYRLSIPPGRYYIGAGAVNSPTYYPNTTNISSAKAIVVSANSILDNINFSQYVTPALGDPFLAAIRTAVALPPGSTGVLSGILRASDGAPVAGIPVLAVPLSVFTSIKAGTAQPGPLYLSLTVSGSRIAVSGSAEVILGVITDNTGRYRFQNVSPDTYKIMSGYSGSPSFYPGTRDESSAQSITTTPTTSLDMLDFTLPAPAPTSAVIRGKVLGNGGRPAGGAEVTLLGNVSSSAVGVGGLLPTQQNKPIRNNGNGTFRFDGIVPGTYTVRAEFPALHTTQSKTVVASADTSGVDFDFPIDTIAGKILWEDGSPLNEPVINEVAVTTVSNPNIIMSDYISVARDGVFSKPISAGEYRFYLRDLPDGAFITSVTADGKDIANTSFEYNGMDPLDIEVRLTRKTSTGTKVSGTILDAMTGKPPAADRVALCCLKTGPFEHVSAPLQRDGTFEFLHIPEGQYRVELPPTTLAVPGVLIEAGTSEVKNLKLLSASAVSGITIQTAIDGGTAAPPSRITITWTAVNSGVSITTYGTPQGMFWNLPSGIGFELTVSDIPPDLKVKSINSNGRPLTPTSQTSKIVTTALPLVITLEPKAP